MRHPPGGVMEGGMVVMVVVGCGMVWRGARNTVPVVRGVCSRRGVRAVLVGVSSRSSTTSSPPSSLLLPLGVKGEVQFPILVLHLTLYDSLHIAILKVGANQVHIDIVWDVIPSTVVDGRLGP